MFTQEQTQAIQVLLNLVQTGQTKGAYNLEEAAAGYQAILFLQEEAKKQPEAVVEGDPMKEYVKTGKA